MGHLIDIYQTTATIATATIQTGTEGLPKDDLGTSQKQSHHSCLHGYDQSRVSRDISTSWDFNKVVAATYSAPIILQEMSIKQPPYHVFVELSSTLS